MNFSKISPALKGYLTIVRCLMCTCLWKQFICTFTWRWETEMFLWRLSVRKNKSRFTDTRSALLANLHVFTLNVKSRPSPRRSLLPVRKTSFLGETVWRVAVYRLLRSGSKGFGGPRVTPEAAAVSLTWTHLSFCPVAVQDFCKWEVCIETKGPLM